METEIMEYLQGSDVLAEFPTITAEQLAAVVNELAGRAFNFIVAIARDVLETETAE